VINRPEEGREKAENQKEGAQIVTGESESGWDVSFSSKKGLFFSF
jgi:hypothetical protein